MDPLTLALLSHATQRSLALWLVNIETIRMLSALAHLRRAHGHGPAIHTVLLAALFGGGS